MPWKVVSILWPTIVSALLPLELGELVALLPQLSARLQRLDRAKDARAPDDRSRPRQVDDFRRLMGARQPKAA